MTNDEALPNVLSVVFHPLLMPMVGTLFILFFSGLYITTLPIQAKKIIVLIIALCTLAFPLMLLLFYWKRRWISNLYLSERQQRVMPMIFTAIFYYIAYRTLHSLHTPLVIQKFVLASTITVFVASVISLRWKISLHGIGIGGITGMLAALSTVSPMMVPALLGAIMLSGVIGYARIRLNAHTPAQYYIGTLLGFIITFGMYFLI